MGLQFLCNRFDSRLKPRPKSREGYCSDVVKTITLAQFFKTKTAFVKTKTFDFFHGHHLQDQDLKNGMKINSLSLITIFL